MIKGTKRFSNPQALGSTFTATGILQPQVFWLLNRLDPLVLVSNYYLLQDIRKNFEFEKGSRDRNKK